MDTLERDRADEEVLRQCLQGSITALGDAPSAIVAVHRAGSDGSGSYGCDVLTLRLDSGEELKVFRRRCQLGYLPAGLAQIYAILRA